MTWVRIDDHFDEHPKLAAAGVVTWGIWLAGIAYCNRNLTDGFIPWSVARNLGGWDMIDHEEADDGRHRLWAVARTCGMGGEDMDTEWVVQRLVHYGLWDVVEGGYRIHDYHDFQPSKEQVLAERKKNADRQRKHRDARNEGSNGVTNGATNGPVTGAPYPYPVPVPLDTYRFESPRDVYLRRTRRKRIGSKEEAWLEDMHASHSGTALVRALEAVDPGPDYLNRVKRFLEGAA